VDFEDIGSANVEALAELAPDCADALRGWVRATPHLVRAVSVARAAGRCPYEAWLIEVVGASDYAASLSLFPGKGVEVHQVLALAVPRLFADFISQREFGRAAEEAEEYVRGALEELRRGLVPPAADSAGTTREAAVVRSATLMARKFAELMSALDGRRIDVDRARVRAELELFDYRLHVRGVVDLLVEEPGRRGVVVEWKTSRGEGGAPSLDEIAQAYLYSVMAAHRLGYADGFGAVLDCAVFPVIIRDGGAANPYSVSRCFKTARRAVNEGALLRKIKLAAAYLLSGLAGPTAGGACAGYRDAPGELLDFGYVPNPRVNRGFPCSYCRLRGACAFYLFSKASRDEVYRIAWRARRSVLRVREGVLQPYYSLARLGSLSGFAKLDGGSRADVFEEAEVLEGELKAVLRRGVREGEAERGLPLTVREGRPVSLFFRDSEELAYSPSFPGVVERVEASDGRISVTVSFEGRFSRLSYFLLRDLLRREGELSSGAVAVEVNVDLTHIELMSIDAFQRATKMAAEELGLPEGEARSAAFKNGYAVKRRLYDLFSIKMRAGGGVR
jgi:molybdopterin-binding protein